MQKYMFLLYHYVYTFKKIASLLKLLAFFPYCSRSNKIFVGTFVILAHLAEGQLSLWDGAASVACRPSVHQRFPSNDLFSKTARLISAKFGRKHL